VKEEPSTPPNLEELRQRLSQVREALLQLHKALLESERTSYERTFGKVVSPYQFWKLVTDDPWFAWVQPVTQMVTAVDEALDAKEPLTAVGVEELFFRARTLLVPAESGQGFSQHYDEALQRDPDVVFAHAAVAKLLRTQAGNAP
jgi:hypothetical protein